MSWREGCGPYIGVSELKQRGWSPAMITKFLGAPDSTAPNPGGPKAPRVTLWLFTRVEDVENTEEFQRRQQQATERRAAQHSAGSRNAEPGGRS